MRHVTQPGPVHPKRLAIVPTRGRLIELPLHAGEDLHAAIVRAAKLEGVESAWLEIRDVPAKSLAYVIPDKAPTNETVAWYSKTHRLAAPARIDQLGLILGTSDGNAFLHGHGLWHEEGKDQRMGHIFAHETILAQDTKLTGIALDDACFDRRFDEETNFPLFEPVARRKIEHSGHALVRIKPNEDFALALDVACSRLGWNVARAHGLGSLVEADFVDGTRLDSFATEFLILDAICGENSSENSSPEIIIIGEDGDKLMRGRLSRGNNPILITSEILLERIDQL